MRSVPIVLWMLFVGAAATATLPLGSTSQPLIIYVDDIPDGDSIILQITNVGGKLVHTRLTNVERISFTDVDAPDTNPDIPNPDMTAIQQVKAAMVALGQKPAFDQQVTSLINVLVIPDDNTNRDLSYSFVNHALHAVLGNFAVPEWKPWLDPFVTAMEGAGTLEELRAVVDGARASLVGE